MDGPSMLVRWVLVLSQDMLTLDETNRPIAQCVTRFAACIPASCSSVRSHSDDFRRDFRLLALQALQYT
jgi:hypothetical protein